MILTFRQTLALDGNGGAYAREYTCRELPRISILRQRARAGLDEIQTVFVAGIKNCFPTVPAAVDSLRANPRPGDPDVPELEQAESL